MSDTSRPRPLQPAPLDPATVIVRGEWCCRRERRGEYAVLATRSSTVMLDKRAIEMAALALGLRVTRRAP